MACATNACEWCGRELEPEEIESPLGDQGVCDVCHHEPFEFTCHWCQDYEAIDEECKIGSLFALFEPVPAHRPWFRYVKSVPWYDYKKSQMRPGVYRILEWPIYWDAILSSGLYAESFAWFCRLPAEMAENGGYGGYPCGPLCVRCQWKLKHAKWHYQVALTSQSLKKGVTHDRRSKPM